MPAKPRIQFLVDRPRRAQARTARAIARHLADDFEIRIRCETDGPDLAAWPCDVLHMSSWDSTWYRHFDLGGARLIKCVTDLRWAEPAQGGLTAGQLAHTWLADADLITCCSERLRHLLGVHRQTLLTPVGFDPFVFPVRDPWRGPLQFGWAGDPADPASGFRTILAPAVDDEIPLHCPGGELQLAEFGAFFRSIDVFAMAAPLEGAPLTLVEALASGCFPVCVNTGLVPELVVHGENGLIVEPDPRAFREAFAWCLQNPDLVRRVGRRGAERLRPEREWQVVAEHWRHALWIALGENRHRDSQARRAVLEFEPPSVTSVPAIR